MNNTPRGGNLEADLRATTKASTTIKPSSPHGHRRLTQPAQPSHHQQQQQQQQQPKQLKPDAYIKDEMFDIYTFPLDKLILQNIHTGDMTHDLVKEGYKTLNVQIKFSHGKTIAPSEPYFRCIDCEVLKNTNQRTYLCRLCFEKSEHFGHRFLLFNDATGNETCDCGNETLLNRKGFCPDHGTCSKEDYDKIIEAVQQSSRENLYKVLGQTMYEVAFACEVQRQGLQGNVKAAVNKAMDATLNCAKTDSPKPCSFHSAGLLRILTKEFKHPETYRNFVFINEKTSKE